MHLHFSLLPLNVHLGDFFAMSVATTLVNLEVIQSSDHSVGV